MVNMGEISDHAANACIYTTYACVLLMGLVVAYYYWSKPFTNDNGTRVWWSLVWNFIASGKLKLIQRQRTAGAPNGAEIIPSNSIKLVLA